MQNYRTQNSKINKTQDTIPSKIVQQIIRVHSKHNNYLPEPFLHHQRNIQEANQCLQFLAFAYPVVILIGQETIEILENNTKLEIVKPIIATIAQTKKNHVTIMQILHNLEHPITKTILETIFQLYTQIVKHGNLISPQNNILEKKSKILFQRLIKSAQVIHGIYEMNKDSLRNYYTNLYQKNWEKLQKQMRA